MAAGALAPAAARAQARITQEEALRLAFPRATAIERRTAYLGSDELARAEAHAGPGVSVESGVVSYYIGMAGDGPLGVAYFDAHRVRTLPEVVMIVVSPAGRIQRIEVLQFLEPPQYRAPEGWLRQFDGRALDGRLSLKGEIVNMTGATLTSEAVTAAARRVLALHEVIRPFAREKAP